MSQGGGPVDLGAVANNPDYEVNVKRIETPEERSSRIKREEAEATHKRRIFWALFTVVLFTAATATTVALVSDDPATREWGRTTASAIVAGLIGYFGGSVGRAPS